jgi:hypothetical protein
MSTLRAIIHFFFPFYGGAKSTTVRYAFPLVFAVAAFLTATSLVSQNTSFITLESSAKTVRAGDTFSINVYVTAHVPINAVDVALSFPKNQIRVLGIDTGESVITLWTEEPKVEGSTVVMRGGTFRKGFLGKHLIATINAKAIETGAAQLSAGNVTFLAGDGSGSKVSVTKNGSEKQILFIEGADTNAVADTTKPIALKGEASIAIVTDLDGDGVVTLKDISRFMASWQNKSALYDFNGDGKMTFRDFGIILADSFIR